MGLRFRRSLKLAPGLRMNFSGSGVSLTTGTPGASVNFGARGAFINTGIPGTGFYSRTRLGSAPSSPSVQPGKVNVEATVRVEDDGTIEFLDGDGNPLSDYLTNLAKRQQGGKIRELLEQTSKKINEETAGLAKLHVYTPKPVDTPQFPIQPYDKPVPPFPSLKGVGLLARLFGKREKIEQENIAAKQRHETQLASWQLEKAQYEATQLEQAESFSMRLRTDMEFMHQVFEENLFSISWPRETLVSFEILDQGRIVGIDVDLPEIEDMQRKVASVPERGYKLSLKEIKGKSLQTLYSKHVHALGFRIIGEAFASLPTAELVVLSAFTQRTDSATGHPADNYLYSASIPRAAWSKLNFENLESVDAVTALEQFELRRKIARNGALDAIEPFQPSYRGECAEL